MRLPRSGGRRELSRRLLQTLRLPTRLRRSVVRPLPCANPRPWHSPRAASSVRSTSSLERLRVSLPVASCRSLSLLLDRKSTRLNSSHVKISYTVFCLKKKKKYDTEDDEIV